MSKPSTVRHQHVEDDILSKAAALFDELGYGRTSLQDIAEAVGIARPSLYHYFSSKEEILATLVEHATTAREDIVDEVRRMDGTPRVRLSALLRNIGRSTSANPAGLRLTLNNNGSLPPEIRQRNARSRRVLFELLTEILAEGVDTGVLQPMNVRESAATMIAALTGLQYREIGGIRMDPDHAAELLEHMLISGITQPTERQASDVDQALGLLHRDLALLEHHLRRHKPAENPPTA